MIDGLRERTMSGVRPVFVGIYWPSAVFPLEKGDCETTSPAEVNATDTFAGQLRRWAGDAFPSAARATPFESELADFVRQNALLDN